MFNNVYLKWSDSRLRSSHGCSVYQNTAGASLPSLLLPAGPARDLAGHLGEELLHLLLLLGEELELRSDVGVGRRALAVLKTRILLLQERCIVELPQRSHLFWRPTAPLGLLSRPVVPLDHDVPAADHCSIERSYGPAGGRLVVVFHKGKAGGSISPNIFDSSEPTFSINPILLVPLWDQIT
jgi:hypothetical protein